MTKNIFGTDGIRNIVGASPFTQTSLPQLGYALGLWIQQKHGRNATLLLGHDTRQSCSFVKAGLKSGLLLHPINLYDANILTSPAVFQLIQNQTLFNCGIIISASHNYYQDNGIKVLDSNGKLSEIDELAISSFFSAHHDEYNYTDLGTDISWQYAQEQYIATIISYFQTNFLWGKKIVLDCAHGAAYKLAPTIFQRLGAQIIPLHYQPNGININKNCGTLHPQHLQKAVVDCNADAGFAFDGDADRVIVVNKQGQVKNGDDIITLLLQHPLYNQQKTVVGTVMTNQGLEYYLNAHGRQLLRTPVGDKYVAASMIEHNVLLGGEQSGHIIVRDYLNTGDGIFIALRILEALQYTNNWDMITFIKFPQVLINIPVMQKKDLLSSPIADIIKASEAKLHTGRLVIRYSGTESLLRIMIEEADFDLAQSIGTNLSKQLLEQLS